jgi:hypothetical protein
MMIRLFIEAKARVDHQFSGASQPQNKTAVKLFGQLLSLDCTLLDLLALIRVLRGLTGGASRPIVWQPTQPSKINASTLKVDLHLSALSVQR